MGKYIKLFNSHQAYEDFTESEDFILPNVSRCDFEKDVHYSPRPYDYTINYLTFEPLEDGTFSFTTNNIDYSLDEGKTWTTLIAGTNTPIINSGNKILWKTSGLTPTPSNGIGTFSSTGYFEVYGNIMSIVYGDNFETNKNFPVSFSNNFFTKLFLDCAKLTNAKNLILPATTLKLGCYKEMFRECTSLTTAPELPATTLTSSCYYSMFQDCTSLTTAPVLPAETLVAECYTRMFYNCSSLNYIEANFKSGLDASSCLSDWLSGVSSRGEFIKNPLLNISNVVGINYYIKVPDSWVITSSFTVLTINSNNEFTTNPVFWAYLTQTNKMLYVTLNNIQFSGTVAWNKSTQSIVYTGISGDKTLITSLKPSRDRSGDIISYSAKYTIQNMTLNVNDVIKYSYYYKDIQE